MITSFEVGAVFKIINEASPALAKILKQVRELNAAITKAKESLATLSGSFSSLGLGTAVTETGELAAAWGDVAKNAAAARREMATASTAARRSASGGAAAAAGAGGSGGGRGPRGRVANHRGWVGRSHISGPSVPLGGGYHARGSGGMGGVAMALGAAAAYGIYEEAEVEDIAARAMITGQIKVDSGMSATDTYAALRKIIQKNSLSGGYSPTDVGEAVLGSERQFAGLPFQKRMDVLNTMLPFAMQEGRLKESGLKESAEALVGISHMTGTYDTDKLPDLYRKFAYASQLTPKSLPQFQTALSYAMPSLVGGMGMDPDAVMFLTAMNQSAGIGSSKAGTWIQSFFSKLMPATGANLSQSKEIHNAELKKLGLLDARGKPSWMVPGANGKTDWMASLMKLSPLLGDKLAAMPDTERMQTLDDVFGKQGGREAGLFNLPEFIAQFPQLAKQLKMATGGDDVLKAYGEGSPVQQARNTTAELTSVLMNLGQTVLPSMVLVLKDVDATLKAIQTILPGGQTGQIGARVTEGAGIGAFIGAIGGPGGVAGGAAIGGVVGGAYGVAEQYYMNEVNRKPQGITDAQFDKKQEVTQALAAGAMPPISVSANIDGKALFRILMDIGAASFSGQAPAFDGTQQFPNGDHQHSDK